MLVGKVYNFVKDEVERQGYKRGSDLWQERVAGMMMAWGYAIGRAETVRYPDHDEILTMAHFIEPDMNNGSDYRACEIFIGGKKGYSPAVVPALMDNFVKELAAHPEPSAADALYLRFEKIHPFADGNGRTGKIIHNWMLGRLYNPVLVTDFFGGGIP